MDERPILDEKYSYSLIIYLYENSDVSISSLKPDVSKNYRAIRELVDKMENEGLVKLDKQYSPRRKFTVKLTKKGEKVAEKLLEIESLI